MFSEERPASRHHNGPEITRRRDSKIGAPVLTFLRCCLLLRCVMAYWIVVQCLACGHVGALSESKLPRFGEKPDAPIAKFIKRLTCEECGSRSVKAWREQRPAA
jgi:hypothetical protein